MTLPPLANLFAVHDEDPSSLDAIAADLACSGEFAEVWRPASGWVAAAAPLPHGDPDGNIVRENRLAFAEGRDVITAHASSPQECFQRVTELTDASPERLVSLPGDFGFIRFRPDGAATVVRSCGGLVPFYLWHSGRRLAVSTRLGDFVRYFPDEFRLDSLVNAVWAAGFTLFPDSRTFLTGVSILERGCFARIERGGQIAYGRFWNPRPQRLTRPTRAGAQEHAERLRTLLLAKLARDLDPEGGNLLTLGGGVDSSCLAALAAGVLGRQLWTWSFLPAPEDLFQREMAYIEPLAARFDFKRRWSVRVTETTRVDLLHAAPPVVFQIPHPALCALPGIMREAPVRVLLGGEFADNVCGSSAFTFPDWAAHTSPVALLTGLHRLPSGRRDVLRWIKHRWLPLVGKPRLPFLESLPEFIRLEVREEYCEWLERRKRAVLQDHAPLRYLALGTEHDPFVAMNWEAASALGVRRCLPFFNREVLELAFECHPSELVGPGSKKLLRTALRLDVPPKNLERPDKGYWGGYLTRAQIPWQRPLPDGLEAVLEAGCFSPSRGTIGMAEACGFAQLVQIQKSLNARRRERMQQREVELGRLARIGHEYGPSGIATRFYPN